jgi:hypothetical protein
MFATVCWLALLRPFAAIAADLPGPWVEMASDGCLDVRSLVAPGMACPKVVAGGAALNSTGGDRRMRPIRWNSASPTPLRLRAASR